MSFFNWFLDPVKNHYADFEGRATRQQFWMFVLVSIIISVVISILEGAFGTMFLGVLFSLAILLPNLAIGARRLHDTGMSGWWQLVVLVPFIGWIILIILFARKGEAGPNKYGAHPEATSSAVPAGTPAEAANVDAVSSEPESN